jgi:hypothetical protein
MATNGATTEQKEGTDTTEEQIVNIETVVVADNKGIDYDKLTKQFSNYVCSLRRQFDKVFQI